MRILQHHHPMNNNRVTHYLEAVRRLEAVRVFEHAARAERDKPQRDYARSGDLQGAIGRGLKLADVHAKLAEAEAVDRVATALDRVAAALEVRSTPLTDRVTAARTQELVAAALEREGKA